MNRMTIRTVLLLPGFLLGITPIAAAPASPICLDWVSSPQPEEPPDGEGQPRYDAKSNSQEITGELGVLRVDYAASKLEFRANDGAISSVGIDRRNIGGAFQIGSDRFGNFALSRPDESYYVRIGRSERSSRIVEVRRFDELHGSNCSYLWISLFGSDGCFEPGVWISRSLGLTFVHGYDWLERKATYLVNPEANELLSVGNARVGRLHDVPHSHLLVAETVSGDLYTYDGTDFRDLEARIVGPNSYYIDDRRGDLYSRDDEKLVHVRGERTDIVPLPRSSYGNFHTFVSLADGRTILGLLLRKVLLIRDGKVDGVYDIPGLGSWYFAGPRIVSVAEGRLLVELSDENRTAGRLGPKRQGELYLCPSGSQ